MSDSWKTLVGDASPVELEDETLTVETFSRKCTRAFYKQQLSKASYFHCGCVVWMTKLLEQKCGDGSNITAQRMWNSITKIMSTCSNTAATNRTEDVDSSSSSSTIAQWILPCMESIDLQNNGMLMASFGGRDEDDEDVDTSSTNELRYLLRLVQFWKRFYECCEASSTSIDNPRPTKRRRTAYSYGSKSNSNSTTNNSASSSDELLTGSYKVSASYLLAWILLDCGAASASTSISISAEQPPLDAWNALHSQVHRMLSRTFKAFTVEDIQAGLTVLGLQCLMQGRRIPGLTPSLLLSDYLSRTGYVLSLLFGTILYKGVLVWFCTNVERVPSLTHHLCMYVSTVQRIHLVGTQRGHPVGILPPSSGHLRTFARAYLPDHRRGRRGR
jgi:hypothetical protein